MLCKKCKSQAINTYGYQRIEDHVLPWVHCHHGEKAKDKCWCSYSESDRAISSVVYENTDYRFPRSILYHSTKANYCPDCGRRLEEE